MLGSECKVQCQYVELENTHGIHIVIFKNFHDVLPLRGLDPTGCRCHYLNLIFLPRLEHNNPLPRNGLHPREPRRTCVHCHNDRCCHLKRSEQDIRTHLRACREVINRQEQASGVRACMANGNQKQATFRIVIQPGQQNRKRHDMNHEPTKSDQIEDPADIRVNARNPR